MIYLALKVILCVAALSKGVFASVKELPSVPTKHHSVIVSPPLDCEETCEFRLLSYEECQVNMSCFLRNLLSPAVEGDSSDEEDGNSLDEEDRDSSNEEDRHAFPQYEKRHQKSKCQGKCLFTDKKENSCRLDLICALDRDVEGTLRYLVDLNVDPETAIVLALGASSNEKSSSSSSSSSKDNDDDANRRRCNNYVRPAPPPPPPAPCDSLCEFRNDEGKCQKISGCSISVSSEDQKGSTIAESKIEKEEENEEEEEEEEEEDEATTLPDFITNSMNSISIAPFNDCSGKCQVVDPNGDCITDFDCLKAEQ